ncbi:MAG: endonuclease/exonuclease/phosphatase family protein, partial [Chloroflexota bacterium]
HLFVLNTHLGTLSGEDRHDPGHPRTVEGNAMRLHQAEGLARVTAELRAAEAAAAVPQRPILLTGDFNAIPGSEPMDTLIASGYRLLSVENTPDEAYTHNVHKLLIDHVLVHDPAGVLPAGHAFVGTDLPFDDLTDHRPVIAIFD